MKFQIQSTKSNNKYIVEDALSFLERQTDNYKSIIEQIVETCNEDLLYSILFAFNFKGQKYTPDKAQSFLDYALKGWKGNKNFVFVIHTEDDKLAGIIEIKSNDKECSEIGYWSSAKHQGIMTNALRELKKYAKSEGYKKLGATVRVNNFGSQKVLKRNGFEFVKALPLSEDKAERVWLECLL